MREVELCQPFAYQRYNAGRIMGEVSTLFDEEFLRKLEYLKLVANRMIPGQLRGEHRARKKGTGVEFADYRPYVSGDDTKDVDWRAYLRLDKLILRIFDEEADLPIYLFVDSSLSMNFGDPSKFDYARKVAAALGYIGLLNLDRVSVIGFDNGVSAQIASKRGRNQIWRIFKFLERMETSGEDVARAVAQDVFRHEETARTRRDRVRLHGSLGLRARLRLPPALPARRVSTSTS